MLTENELKALADEGYNRIAVVEQCLADLDTPLSIYLKLANRAESFLLESVEAARALPGTPSLDCLHARRSR